MISKIRLVVKKNFNVKFLATMDGIIRKRYTANFKKEVVLAALRENHTLSELSSKFKVDSTQIRKWKSQLIDGIPDIFSSKATKKEEAEKELLDELNNQIGQLTVENDWLKKRSHLWKKEIVLIVNLLLNHTNDCVGNQTG